MTLLELLIVLAAVAAIIFVALPTLRRSEEEAAADLAKDSLRYLYGMEQRYNARHGEYGTLLEIAKDPSLGKDFDKRFAVEKPLVNGVSFTGPVSKGSTFVITATLADGTKYRIDQTGEIKTGL